MNILNIIGISFLLFSSSIIHAQNDYKSKFLNKTIEMVGESLGDGKVIYTYDPDIPDAFVGVDLSRCYVFCKKGSRFKIDTYRGSVQRQDNLISSVSYDGESYYAYKEHNKTLYISSSIEPLRNIFVSSYLHFPFSQHLYFLSREEYNVSPDLQNVYICDRGEMGVVKKSVTVDKTILGSRGFKFPKSVHVVSKLFKPYTDEGVLQDSSFKVKTLRVEPIEEKEIFFMPASKADRVKDLDLGGVEFDL